ncbi:GGDEF domain-containing protein [Siminovitchia sediminis]|uniref:GGDEF domain-containing protein n=1 Tax=Siminovitchia sediminis TaxID=1274353 RepID=A0ABW4KD47_9BACI
MAAHVGEIVESVPSISVQVKNQEVDRIFSGNPTLQGIVILDNDLPVGLLTRALFYQKMGTLYGYHLYMNKAVELLPLKDPLITDYNQPITEVSKLAMKRKEEDLYDYVIVTKNRRYCGIASIQKLLLKLADIQAEIASFLNPLTGLPGNHMIEAKLKEILHKDQFSVLYIDLDHFKAYNDTYGFKRGDDLLKTIGELLKKVLHQDQAFLGHIGGDDFVAILPHYYYEWICRSIIEEFNKIISSFYHPIHLSQKYVFAENRLGIKEKISIVSVSIAVVTNEVYTFENIEEIAEYAAIVKKKCKMVDGSYYSVN